MPLTFDKSKKGKKSLVLKENVPVMIQGITYSFFMTNEWDSLTNKLKKLFCRVPAENDFLEFPTVHINIPKKMSQLKASWAITLTTNGDFLYYYELDSNRLFSASLNDLRNKSFPVTRTLDVVFAEGTETLKKYVELGGDIEQRFEGCASFLLFAIALKRIDLIKTLIKLGANINAGDVNGTTPLMYTIIQNHLEVFTILLNEKNIDIEAKDCNGTTALIGAADFGDIEAAKLLIKFGAKVDIANLKGYTALMLATRRGHIDVARLLIKAGANINAVDQDGATAVKLAADCGYAEILRLFINAGVNINDKMHDGNGLLIDSVLSSNNKVTAILIEAGADIKNENPNVLSPLLMAVCINDLPIVKMLIKADARLNASETKTALDMIATMKYQTMLKFLLDNKFISDFDIQLAIANNIADESIDAANFLKKNTKSLFETDLTSFCSYCAINSVDEIEKSIQHLNSIDSFSFFDMTPLMCACYGEAVDVVKKLIESGADVNLANKEGKTALMYAASRGNLDMINLLTQSGANLTAKDKNGKPYQDYAGNVDKRSFKDMLNDKYNLRASKENDERQGSIPMERQPFIASFNWCLQRYFERYPKNKTSDIYNDAHISRKLFSQINTNRDPNYHPKIKENVLKLAAGFKLSQRETEYFLQSAGYYFDKNDISDKIIREFISNENWNIDDWDFAIYEKTGKTLFNNDE